MCGRRGRCPVACSLCRVNYPPIGRCIYCGTTDNLTREHIVPLALGGVDVLPEASCSECAKVTAEIERRVLQGSWGGFRWVLGMPTRHKKRRPLSMPAEVRRGGTWFDESLPVSKYTGAATFPIFREPPFLHRIEDDELKWDMIRTILASGVDAVATDSPAVRAGADAYRMPVGFDPKAIARMVAKIAHGYAVEFFGVDGFIPYLSPAILGHTDDIGRWVGSPGGSLFDEPPGRGHRIRVGTYENTVGIIAGVHLFADAGTPEYLIVVGELPAAPRWGDAGA
jgi:hypothetical protein